MTGNLYAPLRLADQQHVEGRIKGINLGGVGFRFVLRLALDPTLRMTTKEIAHFAGVEYHTKTISNALRGAVAAGYVERHQAKAGTLITYSAGPRLLSELERKWSKQ